MTDLSLLKIQQPLEEVSLSTVQNIIPNYLRESSKSYASAMKALQDKIRCLELENSVLRQQLVFLKSQDPNSKDSTFSSDSFQRIQALEEANRHLKAINAHLEHQLHIVDSQLETLEQLNSRQTQQLIADKESLLFEVETLKQSLQAKQLTDHSAIQFIYKLDAGHTSLHSSKAKTLVKKKERLGHTRSNSAPRKFNRHIGAHLPVDLSAEIHKTQAELEHLRTKQKALLHRTQDTEFAAINKEIVELAAEVGEHTKILASLKRRQRSRSRCAV